MCKGRTVAADVVCGGGILGAESLMDVPIEHPLHWGSFDDIGVAFAEVTTELYEGTLLLAVTVTRKTLPVESTFVGAGSLTTVCTGAREIVSTVEGI